jgi:SAM-dependent methyltransferase
VRLAISQAIALGHRDRVLGGELENLSRKLRFLRDALHRVSSQVQQGPTRVLELGCGAGFLSLEMGRQGAEVLGIDISPGQIIVARYFSKNGMHWPESLYPTYQGLTFRPSAFRPPEYEILDLNREQPRGSFDVIFAHDAVHHIASAEDLMGKLDPLLRSGGWVLLIDHQETEEGRRSSDALRGALADYCGRWTIEMPLADVPRAEPYDQKVCFPPLLGKEVMQGLGDWLRREGFPLSRVSEATAETVPPPWPSKESSFEGVGKRDLGRRLRHVAQVLGYEEVMLETAFEPWREELVSLRPEGMDWHTFYALRAKAEDEVLAKSPGLGEFFYLRARKRR